MTRASRRSTQDGTKKTAITTALSPYDEWESTTAAAVLTVTNATTGLLPLGNRTHKNRLGNSNSYNDMIYVCFPLSVARLAGRHEYPTTHSKQEFLESAESMVRWIRSERYRRINFER